MVLGADVHGGAQQWHPNVSQNPVLSGRTNLTSREGRHSPTTFYDAAQQQQSASPFSARRTLTPDEVYFFQKQQSRGSSRQSPRVPQQAPLQLLSPRVRAEITRGQQQGYNGSPVGARSSSVENNVHKLRDEVADLRHLMGTYSEHHPSSNIHSRRHSLDGTSPPPLPSHLARPPTTGSAGSGMPPTDATIASSARAWTRPVPPFALRDQPPRGGNFGLSELPSRFEPPPSSMLSSYTDASEFGREGQGHHLEPLDDAVLARAAAESGVSPAFAGVAGKLPGSGNITFQSHAVRFAVTLAERMQATDSAKSGAPSTEGCYTCLEVLREMLPLLGPLAPVISNVHDALQLCLLSEHHYEAAYADQLNESSSSTSARKMRRNQRAAAHQQKLQGRGRVPYFVLVRKLEEAAAALRLERDTALEEVSRNQADLTNLDEQLTAAKAQLQVRLCERERGCVAMRGICADAFACLLCVRLSVSGTMPA